MSALSHQLSHLAISRGFINQVINEGHLDLAPTFIAPDSLQHSLAAVGANFARGPWGITQVIALYRHAFPDLHLSIEDEVVEEDRVVTRFRMEGRQQNRLMGIEASGRQMSVTGIRIDRIAEGKIAETWLSWDALGMLQQLGALPKLERQPAAAAPEWRDAAASVAAWPEPAAAVAA